MDSQPCAVYHSSWAPWQAWCQCMRNVRSLTFNKMFKKQHTLKQFSPHLFSPTCEHRANLPVANIFNIIFHFPVASISQSRPEQNSTDSYFWVTDRSLISNDTSLQCSRFCRFCWFIIKLTGNNCSVVTADSHAERFFAENLHFTLACNRWLMSVQRSV